MMIKVTIELNYDDKLENELADMVHHDLMDLMRSDIMAGATIEKVGN